MNKIIRIIAGLLLTTAMMLLPAEIIGAAAPAEITTEVKSTRYIKENTTISAGETLYVRSGGKLYINNGVSLTVKGRLKCAAGGEIYVRGRVISKPDSVISVSGKMKILSMGRLDLAGRLNVNTAGEIKGLGSIAVKNDFGDINCAGTVKSAIIPPAPVTDKGVTTVGGIVIVNKEYGLPEDYGDGLDRAAYNSYIRMKRASGFNMSIVSGFRSYEKQVEVFDYWCEVDGEETARAQSAVPGHSEHQTGLVIDVSSLKQSYGDTAEGKWLAENCYKYGFIIRFPEGKEEITGYDYEPWHIRYLGASTAKLVYDSGLALEEFLRI